MNKERYAANLIGSSAYRRHQSDRLVAMGRAAGNGLYREERKPEWDEARRKHDLFHALSEHYLPRQEEIKAWAVIVSALEIMTSPKPEAVLAGKTW